jgi:hypothetical protein
MEQAGEAASLLEKGGYSKEVDRAATEGAFCHNAYKGEALRLGEKGEIFVGSFDKCSSELPLADLAYYLRRYWKKTEGNAKGIMKMLEKYNEHMPLSEDDLTLLQGMLLYPEKFLRLVNEYYNKRRACVSPAMGERLAAAALEEKNGRILKDIVKKGYLSLFPAQMKPRAEQIIDTISKKIGGYVIAQVVTMTSVGIIMAIGLLLIKVEYAVLLGLITAVLDIVPVVGPGLALIICLITAYKSGPLTLALIVLVFAIAQFAENNLVKPYIFGKFLDLHPLIIYLFLFITAQHLGVVGVIFAPAIAATVCVLIEELYIKNIN